MGLFKSITKPFKGIAKALAPVAPLAAFIPGVGLPLAMALAAGDNLVAGNGLRGAVGGGLGALAAGGGGSMLGGYLSDAGNLGLSASQAGALGGSLIGGAGGAIGGGSLQSAALGGALGGASGYVQGSGGFGNAYDNLTGTAGSAAPNVNGIHSLAFNANGSPASGGLDGISTSSSPASDYFTKSGISLSPTSTPSALASATAPAATKTVMNGLTGALQHDPFGALAAGMSIYSNVNQQQQQADLLKEQAAQNQAYNNSMIASLNTPVTPRVQMPVDLANYGHSGTGEGTFFNDPIQKYAKGGMVQGPPMMPQAAQSPLSGMVSGAGGGQDDQVPIMAADGEHVVPADVVAMAGDGSSKQGSNNFRKLEQNIRKAKGVKKTKTIPKKIKANLKAYTE